MKKYYPKETRREVELESLPSTPTLIATKVILMERPSSVPWGLGGKPYNVGRSEPAVSSVVLPRDARSSEKVTWRDGSRRGT